MIGSVVCLHKRYSWQEYVSAMLLISSAVCFSLGDKDVHPQYTTYGLVVRADNTAKPPFVVLT